MKNILFYYDNSCHSGSKGGTELATLRISEMIGENPRFKLFHAYRKGNLNENDNIFQKSVKLSHIRTKFEKTLSDFINLYEIDTIINMGKFFRHQSIKNAIERSKRPVDLMFMHHFAPGSEKLKSNFKNNLKLLRIDPLNPLYLLRTLFYPMIRCHRNFSLRNKYKSVYNISNKIILLSSNYIIDYANYARLENTDKFVVIPNIFNPHQYTREPNKKKQVLILSRMDEIQKRISLALEIWKEIEKDDILKDWHLDIVGTGSNLSSLEKYAKRLKLNNVTFHGWQNSSQFLKTSSILMMTSLYEGLSLSMIESQINQCVPIAFDSYSSITDIIEDNCNGLIIPEGRKDIYIRKLKKLMSDNNYRSILGLNGTKNFNKFNKDTIRDRWVELLCN